MKRALQSVGEAAGLVVAALGVAVVLGAVIGIALKVARVINGL